MMSQETAQEWPGNAEPPKVEDYRPPKTIKLLMIGDTDVGKTAIMRQYCENAFLVNSSATLGLYASFCEFSIQFYASIDSYR